MRLTATKHPNIFGLRHLAQLKVLDLCLNTYNQHYGVPSPYTPQDLSEFQHIKTLRLESRIKFIHLMGQVFIETLINVIPGFTGVRKLQFYAEAPDYPHDKDFGPYCFPSWRGFQDYEHSYENDRSYHALVATLEPLYGQIEDLQLPGGFWSLISETARAAVDLQAFTNLQQLTVPKTAVMGAVARPRHKFWTVDYKGTRDLNDYDDSPDGNGFVDDYGELEEPVGPHVPTRSPVHVLPSSLRHLTIFEADETVCDWLRDIFRYKNVYFADLETVELVVTDKGLEDQVAEMEDKMKEMAMGSGVLVSVKLDTTTIGGPDGK
jgi:hypothetical protein